MLEQASFGNASTALCLTTDLLDQPLDVFDLDAIYPEAPELIPDLEGWDHFSSEELGARWLQTSYEHLSTSERQLQPVQKYSDDMGDKTLENTMHVLASSGLDQEKIEDRFLEMALAQREYWTGNYGPLLDPDHLDLLTTMILSRFYFELEAEEAFATHAFPTQNALSHQDPDSLQQCEWHNCAHHLLKMFLSPEQQAALDLRPYDMVIYATQLMAKILLDHCDPVSPQDRLQPNDIVLYHSYGAQMMHRGASHYGRVAMVKEGRAWVESKWGFGRHACIHPLDQVDPKLFGSKILIARPRRARITTNGSSFANHGFRIPEPRDINGSHLYTLARKRAEYFLTKPIDPDRFHREF